MVQATCVARDCRRALPLKENLTLTNKKWQPQHTPRKFPKTQSTHPFNNSMDDGDYQEVRATSSRRRRCRGQEAMSTCCRRHCPTGGGGLRSIGRSNASRRRGDRGIVAAVTAALAQLSRLSKGGHGRERHSPCRTGGRRRRMPVQDGAMGDREGTEGAMSEA